MRKAGNLATVPIDKTGGMPVNIQDQTTKLINLKFNQISNSTTLTALAVRGAKTITVANTTGFADKKYVIIFDPLSKMFSFYKQVGVVAGNVITLDTPLDYAYPVGANVDVGTISLNVNGNVTPQIFGLRGTGIIPGVELTVDITNIIINCQASSACNLNLFANIAALTKGLILRKRDGDYQNIFNIKSNSGFQGNFYHFEIQQAINPAQGRDGFRAKFAIAGQENTGVAIRLPIGDDLELIVQDDLSSITLLEATAIGHIIQD